MSKKSHCSEKSKSSPEDSTTKDPDVEQRD